MRGWSGRRLALLLRTEGGLTPSIKRLGGGGAGEGKVKKKHNNNKKQKKKKKKKTSRHLPPMLYIRSIIKAISR